MGVMLIFSSNSQISNRAFPKMSDYSFNDYITITLTTYSLKLFCLHEYVSYYQVFVLLFVNVGGRAAVCLKSDVYFGWANCHLSFINNEEKCRGDRVCVFLEATLIFYWRTHWDASSPLTAPGSNNQYWPCDTGASKSDIGAAKKHCFLSLRHLI